jgi:hypothetical protein
VSRLLSTTVKTVEHRPEEVGLTDAQAAEVMPRVRAVGRERARGRRERNATAMELRRAYRQGTSDGEPSNPGPP